VGCAVFYPVGGEKMEKGVLGGQNLSKKKKSTLLPDGGVTKERGNSPNSGKKIGTSKFSIKISGGVLHSGLTRR